MRTKTRVILCALFLACLAGGCKAFEIYQDSAGVFHTPVGDSLAVAGGIVKTVGGVIPGYGLIGGGVALLLSLVGNGIASVVARRKTAANNKLASALEVVAKGVNTATNNYTDLKTAIMDILKGSGNTDVAGKVEKVFADNEGIKRIIQQYATDANIESFLKLFVKTAEATGKV